MVICAMDETRLGGSDHLTSITYNGTSLFKSHVELGNSSTNGAVSVWYLASPSLGSNNLVFTWDATTNIHAEIDTYTGVSGVDVSGGHTVVAGDPNTTTLALSNSGDWAFGCGSSFVNTPITGTVNLTNVLNAPSGFETYNDTGAALGAAGSTNFTFSSGGSDNTVEAVIAFSPSGGGGGVVVRLPQRPQRSPVRLWAHLRYAQGLLK